MYRNTLNQYLKEGIKVSNYNCLYIGNFKKIAYYTYPYYLDAWLYRYMSKIPDANNVHFIIYKDLKSIKIRVYDPYPYPNRSLYYEK